MNDLPHLREIFDTLKRGRHLGPDDEPMFSALINDYEAYAAYFAPLGLKLVQHERDFFYFDPELPEKVPETLPRIAVFAYILVDHAANQGRSVEEFILGENFLAATLPHFSLDRYSSLLRQVEIHDASDLRNVLQHLERIGWLKWLDEDQQEFRFLRPFHRVFSKCLELSQQAQQAAAALQQQARAVEET
jgi:chromosome condensin MukBEF MukE localization factor